MSLNLAELKYKWAIYKYVDLFILGEIKLQQFPDF